MTFAGRIFDQLDVTGCQRNLLAAGNLNLSSSAERDHVLAPRTAMPIAERAGRRATKLHTGNLHHLGRPASQLHFDLLGVTLAIRTSEDPRTTSVKTRH
jgi:hypothetical protein